MKDWEDARTLLISYLLKDQKTAEESEIRSYLTCCAESYQVPHRSLILAPPYQILYQAWYGGNKRP